MEMHETTGLKQRHLLMQNNMEEQTSSLRGCLCCQQAIKTVMSTLQEEHRKEMKIFHAEKEKDLMRIANAQSKILELNSTIDKIKAKVGMAMEFCDNKIKNLQRAILNIRTDVKNGKEPRPPAPLETLVEYESHYDFLDC